MVAACSFPSGAVVELLAKAHKLACPAPIHTNAILFVFLPGFPGTWLTVEYSFAETFLLVCSLRVK
jgi:hypothetical protein